MFRFSAPYCRISVFIVRVVFLLLLFFPPRFLRDTLPCFSNWIVAFFVFRFLSPLQPWWHLTLWTPRPPLPVCLSGGPCSSMPPRSMSVSRACLNWWVRMRWSSLLVWFCFSCLYFFVAFLQAGCLFFSFHAGVSNPLTSTLTLTLRKFVSLVVSIWVFDHPFTQWHGAGTTLLFIGMGIYLFFK